MNRRTMVCMVWVAIVGVAAVAPVGAEQVQWPTEWTVFAPLSRSHPVVDAETLASIPDRLEIEAFGAHPALTLEPQSVPVVPGEPVDLSEAMQETAVGTTAYVFIELKSPVAQDVTLGLGGDWWMECWLNGEAFFDTLETGGGDVPFGVLDNQVEVSLREGRNVLAIRFIRGRHSAVLAAGDAQHFAAERRRRAVLRRARGLNILPENFSDRLIFPADTQAVATASVDIDLSPPDADLSEGALVGLRPMPERQLYIHAPAGARPETRDTLDRRFDDPVTILLSKARYPWEDRHLDAIVWTTPPEEGDALTGSLEVRLLDGQGGALVRHEISELSPSGWFFSVGFPETLAGSTGALEAVWRDGGEEVGRAAAPFDVSEPALDAPASGRIPLRALNEPGATLSNAPMTVGVPFPRGHLLDDAHVRLVDEAGAPVPLQTRVTARWSRYGPVKWLLCDFAADLGGEGRAFFLEYGPGVSREERAPMTDAASAQGLPALDTGRLRVDEAGVAFDAEGDGVFEPVLGPGALRGAFVRHENGRTYVVPADVTHTLEESGGEKAVVRRTGWYVEEDTGDQFCQFVTRLVFHRGSPVVRIFHTWIFTGDANRDRIADMGWRFEAVRPVAPEGFLAHFDTMEWIHGESLVQHDHSHYNLTGVRADIPGRAPGVLSATVGERRVLFGAKDFWQNFPSELEFSDGAFTFYNWPRHNPPATFERPVPRDQAFLHRFAHEGEALDFRLPQEYTEDPIWPEACSRERHWAENRPETANAQGIARTEEMFLYFAEPGQSRDAAERVMRGLNDESLRAVVAPEWIAASDVFGDFHPRDVANYPEDEHMYEQVVKAPSRWNERLGFYGMWLHGDLPAWSIELERQTASLYRTIRKNHHGWPMTWMPFVRSGDPQYLKLAEAAVRQMTDANFCHYATEEVNASVGPTHFRRQGWWDRSLLPWAGRTGPHLRSYTVDCDYIWDAYYLTGYARARDVGLLFGELTQQDHLALRSSRTTESVLPSYLRMYQATFDPWFLAAAHDVARVQKHGFEREEPPDKLTHERIGSNWRWSYEDFYRFTGAADDELFALSNAISYTSPNTYGYLARWDFISFPYIRQAAFAWLKTGDEFYLGRLAGYLDWVGRAVYDGEVEYGRGAQIQASTARGIFTGYYIRIFPYALAAFERAGQRPEPLPDPFFVQGDVVAPDDPEFHRFELPEILFRKVEGQPVVISLAHRHGATRRESLVYTCTVTGAEGETALEAEWPSDMTLRKAELPADAPAGQYRLSYGGRKPTEVAQQYLPHQLPRIRWIRLPAADPDVPEVLRLEQGPDGLEMPGGQPECQYWFKVPEGAREFWIEFPNTRSDRFNRVSVWNPDRERVWDMHHEGRGPGRVTIQVPPGQDGRVWGASAAMGGFRLDPAIPPYVSLTQSKWFQPE